MFVEAGLIPKREKCSFGKREIRADGGPVPSPVKVAVRAPISGGRPRTRQRLGSFLALQDEKGARDLADAAAADGLEVAE